MIDDEYKWFDKHCKPYKLSDMKDSHILNCINICEKTEPFTDFVGINEIKESLKHLREELVRRRDNKINTIINERTS